jgi:hypothetical protein
MLTLILSFHPHRNMALKRNDLFSYMNHHKNIAAAAHGGNIYDYHDKEFYYDDNNDDDNDIVEILGVKPPPK